MHLRPAAGFSDYKKQFPNVQLHVDRSYGSRVVGAVLDNLADFGFTQLPVQEKKLQVVKIHSDEIRLIAPAAIRWRARIDDVLRSDVVPTAASEIGYNADPPQRLDGTC